MCRPLPSDLCSCVDWITGDVALGTCTVDRARNTDHFQKDQKQAAWFKNHRNPVLLLFSVPAPLHLLVSFFASTAAWYLVALLRAEIWLHLHWPEPL